MSEDQDGKNARRQFFKVSGRYGIKVAMFAATVGTTGGLAAYAAREAHAQQAAKYRLRIGASVYSPATERLLPTGIYDFAEHLQKITDGAVHVSIIDSARACAEDACGTRVAQGVLDIGVSAPHNLASVMQYAIAAHWTFLWDDHTEYMNFLISDQYDKLYRDVMRKAYKVEVLFGGSEMRNLYMGLAYRGRQEIATPAQLKGSKIRITNSPMIQAFVASLGMNPIPLSWTELLEGLKSGIVDSTETYPGAIAAFGMTGVVSQEVKLSFTPGGQLVFMNSGIHDKLPVSIRSAIREASKYAMVTRYNRMAEARAGIAAAFSKGNIKEIKLSEAQMAEFRGIGAVERNPKLYSDLRRQLDSIAGFDVYEEMKAFQKTVSGKPYAG